MKLNSVRFTVIYMMNLALLNNAMHNDTSDAVNTTLRLERVKNMTRLLDNLLHGYDKSLRPGFGGPPTLVDVNLNIRSMGPVSEIDMMYQMDCYFRQSWVDRRLKFDSSLRTLRVAVNILDELWKPDTHFFNGRKSHLHTVTTPNKLLRLNHDGRILYSMRITIQASCPMHLERYPMDLQVCPLSVGSHGYTDKDVIYAWTSGEGRSIKMAPDMTLSQFDLISFPQGNGTKQVNKEGSHSALFANFIMRRHMGYFVINVYVPCSILVILSWVGFWINREATADRITLGVTTVLTMAFLGVDLKRDMPKVSYSTALDYFNGICFFFVLATIVQFSGVHYFTKHGSGDPPPFGYSDSEEEEEDEESYNRMRQRLFYAHRLDRYHRRRRTDRSNGKSNVTLHYDDVSTPATPESCCVKFSYCLRGSASYRDLKARASRDSINSVSKLDTIARFVFPFTFIGFNIFYWTSYYRAYEQELANVKIIH